MNVLTLVKSFICTVEEGSFTSAAKKLGVSKSLVSRNVKDLETYLSASLMNRSTKTFALTDAGKLYYQEANVLVSRFESLNNAVRFDGESITGALNVLAPKGFSEILLMPFICKFANKYPSLKVNLRLHDDLDSLDQIGYDVAIRSGSLVRQDFDLIATKLVEHRNVICASPKYISEHGEINEPIDILSHRIIEDPNLKLDQMWMFTKGNEVKNIPINPAMTVNSVQAVRYALLDNFGLAMIPKLLAQDEIDSGRLIELFPEYDLPKREVYALYHGRANMPKKVRVLIDELKSYFAEW
ncbi:LysR family transcriptional regulator [Vibrio splendidus]|uniref:LysR family transcriptional regulator n=1 Tax=Vibrio splendidus TaxID=29497 RepID=UPI000769FD8C|nr:LysR family transcriptional regulator [Vibrio splendidus]PHX05522.1 HTH-type transcriptional regulator DmlR [Vibrio splendidus]